MRTSIKYTIVGIVVLFVTHGCKLEHKNYLPPLKIEIPVTLKDNPEVAQFIKESTQSLNQWSMTFEDLVVECQPFQGKEESELTPIEKLKLGKIMMEFVANLGQFAVSMAELQQLATSLEDRMNEKELAALLEVMILFENRIQQINDRYNDFGKEEAGE